MKRYVFFVLTSVFLFFSCSETNQSDLPEIPVDIDLNNPLPLSEIAEEITAIELELTDESMINPDMINRVIISGNNIVVGETNKILVFNKDGKFIRSIGSRGQGPGEYIWISALAIDERNNHLLVISGSKIICYDLTGKFLRETFVPSFQSYDINNFNEELLTVGNKVTGDDRGNLMSSNLYRLNSDLLILDSLVIRNNYFEGGMSLVMSNDCIFKGGSSIYLYYSEVYYQKNTPAEVVLRDTLYRYEKNELVPELKLKFKNDGIRNGNKFINLIYIYKSSRYVFSHYHIDFFKDKYYFCYDTKTGKSYNMQDGYTDDINGIDKPVTIRPFNHDTEMFYYLHTHMKPGDLEEPNPTLYLGKLKK